MTAQELQTWLLERISRLLKALRKLLFGVDPEPAAMASRSPAIRDDPVVGRLDQEADRFEREAVAYRLFVEASRQSISPDVRRVLVGRFGEAFSAPVLELTRVFRTTSEHVSADRVIAEWLCRRGYALSRDAGTATQLEEYLLERAQNKAVEVIRGEVRAN